MVVGVVVVLAGRRTGRGEGRVVEVWSMCSSVLASGVVVLLSPYLQDR